MVALERGQPDRVPIFEIQIDEPVVLELARLLGISRTTTTTRPLLHAEESAEVLDLYCQVIQELNLDTTCFPFSIGLQSINDRLGRDKYGCTYLLSEHGAPVVMEGPIKQASDLRGYSMVSRLALDDFAKVKYIIDRVGKQKAHFVIFDDPFKVGWLLRGGMANLMIDFGENPELAHSLARVSTDWCLAGVDMIREIGADGIVVGGDLAGEQNILISPKHYREFVKPYQKEIVDRAHRQGLRIVKHTDGNAWRILDDLIEVGFDGFNPIQPQCMDIVEVKKHVAGRMCLLGNIDCRDLLPFGTPEQVERVVKETIAKAAPGGGYIICSSNSIHAGCKAENYMAMVKAALRYGAYD
jgi:uroporphyrinogen decarboxylase